MAAGEPLRTGLVLKVIIGLVELLMILDKSVGVFGGKFYLPHIPSALFKSHLINPIKAVFVKKAYQQVSPICILTLNPKLICRNTKAYLNAARCNPSDARYQMINYTNCLTLKTDCITNKLWVSKMKLSCSTHFLACILL